MFSDKKPCGKAMRTRKQVPAPGSIPDLFERPNREIECDTLKSSPRPTLVLSVYCLGYRNGTYFQLTVARRSFHQGGAAGENAEGDLHMGTITLGTYYDDRLLTILETISASQ
jgi:hypothetical protein